MKKIIYIAFILLFQTSFSQEILDSYIKEGLESNLVLKQKTADYEKSIYVLREAKGLFMPSLSIHARYSIAEGGRTIYLPIGDMLNPVYYTLNKISTRMYELGVGDEIFPLMSVENEEINFLRPTEHETKAQIIQPLFNPQIWYNNKIKTELADAEKADLDTYRRQLVADIKTSWYNYQTTLEIIDLLDQTQEVLEENIRVNQKLFENDKITMDAVYQSQTELAKLQEMQADAIMQSKTAAAYFNFLLNHEQETEINIPEKPAIEISLIDLTSAQNEALEKREELNMLQSYHQASLYNLKLNKANKLPTLVGVLDYGFQGEEYKFTKDYDFVMASFVLRWDLFKGFQNKNKIQQAVIDQKILLYKHEELEQQINLQVTNAYYKLEASVAKINTAEKQVRSSTKAFEIIEKKYKEGQSGLLEFMNARNNMTQAKQNLIMAKLNYQVSLVEFERITGAYVFPESNNNSTN